MRREWVVYAPHRNSRPWDFSKEVKTISGPSYSPTCYLCPRNKRGSGKDNPDYKGVFVFDNDFPVVGMNAPELMSTGDSLYMKESAKGISRVVCYSENHNISMSRLTSSEILSVVNTWANQTAELLKQSIVKSVLIFENKGQVTGVSNPHPHCQIYATDFQFKNIEDEYRSAILYKESKGKNLFGHVIQKEKEDGLRIIAENDKAIAFIPFFARYAYEIMVFPKRRCADMSQLTPSEIEDLSTLYHHVVKRYDLLFRTPFPYVMNVHQMDHKLDPENLYHLYFHFQPPWRAIDLPKYLAGPEIGGGNFMADTLPEEKAKELRDLDLASFEELYKL